MTLIPAFTLGSGSTLEAKGTGTGTGTTAARIQGASGGTVNLGKRPVNLTFTPTVFTGDTARPALLVSEGTLVLNNNTFTVNNAAATALGVGVYRLIEVTRNTVTQNASPFYPVSVTGSGLESGTAATISVSSGQVILTVDVADTTYTSWAADKGLQRVEEALGVARERDASLAAAQREEPVRFQRFTERLAALAGGMQRLPRQIPLKHAMGMLLTGRRVPAEEALRLGFGGGGTHELCGTESG